MKAVIEGTEQQIENLKKLMEVGTDLPRLRENYYQTENLWCIDDVKGNFDCDDDEAMGVLEDALQNDATMEHIWFAINYHAEEEGLVREDSNNN